MLRRRNSEFMFLSETRKNLSVQIIWLLNNLFILLINFALEVLFLVFWETGTFASAEAVRTEGKWG